MTPQMYFAIILMVFATVMILLSYEKLNKAKKIAKEAKVETESAKEEIKNLEKRNKALNEHIDHLRANMAFGETNPLRYGMVKTNSFVDVFAVYESLDGRHEIYIRIKRFEFGDDREFALLEAQELLDHLNGK